jgi:hypothetical protein
VISGEVEQEGQKSRKNFVGWVETQKILVFCPSDLLVQIPEGVVEKSLVG